jgi:predicted ATP-grasp superfamily ATP-dependent carboligase
MMPSILATFGLARSLSSEGHATERLLLTEDAPGYGVLAGLRGLRAAGFEPWLAVTSRGGYGTRSRARAGVVTVPDPALDKDAYVRALADAARRAAVAAVLPGTEVALIALAGAQDAFPAGVAVGACEPAIVRRATDKLELAALAADVGLTTVPTRVITHTDVEAGADVTYPAVVKAPRSCTPTPDGGLESSPAHRVSSQAELRMAIESLPGERWLLQPYVAGRLAAVCGIAWRGALVCAVHQVAERIYPPDCGISAYASTVAPDQEVEQRVGALLAALDWSGLFEVQFLSTADGNYLIDLNPRMYGSLALAIGAGLNLPAIWAELLLGRRPEPKGYERGVRFRSEERDAGALTAALMRRQWTTVLRGLIPRKGTVHAVFRLRDPLPILSSLRQLRIAPALIGRGHRR